MSKEISRSSPIPAFDMVMRPPKFDFNRPHTYKWTEHPELSIEDPRYFTIEVIWLDEEENDTV